MIDYKEAFGMLREQAIRATADAVSSGMQGEAMHRYLVTISGLIEASVGLSELAMMMAGTAITLAGHECDECKEEVH